MTDTFIEKSVKEAMYHVIAWMEDEGDYQPTEEEAQEKVRAIILAAVEHGREEGAHKTEDGYCCACGFDIADFEERLREAKAPSNLHLSELKRAHEHGKHDGAKELVSKMRGWSMGHEVISWNFESFNDWLTDMLTDYLPKIIP